MEQAYGKVQGLVELVHAWLNGGKDQGIRVLWRIPQVRYGLLATTMRDMKASVDRLEEYVKQMGKGREHRKLFFVERPDASKMDILSFILHCMRCFLTVTAGGKRSTGGTSLDLLRVPADDLMMRNIIHIVNKNNEVTVNDPLFEQMLA